VFHKEFTGKIGTWRWFDGTF